eukprot:gene10347-10504_t
MTAAPLGPKPVVLFNFTSQRVVDKWHVFTDASFGGKSQASISYNQQEQAAEFSGRVTLDQEEDADIKRAGYCVANSQVQYVGDYYDLSGVSHLVYTVKGDGRMYIANVRTDSIVGTGGDLWQAPFKTSAGKWSQVSIPIDSLALTYQGQLVQQKLEFQADKVISVGVAVSAAMPTSDRSTSSHSASDTSLEECAARSLESPAGEQDCTSGSSDASSSTAVIDGQAQVPSQEHFRLFIRHIQAHGEQ